MNIHKKLSINKELNKTSEEIDSQLMIYVKFLFFLQLYSLFQKKCYSYIINNINLDILCVIVHCYNSIKRVI